MATPISISDQPEKITGNRLIVPGWLRNPAGVILIAAAIFGLLGTMTVFLEIGRPFGEFAAFGFIDSTVAELVHETPEWWLPIAFGRLQYGDGLLTINGLPFTPNAWSEMAASYEREEMIELEILRPGEEMPLTVILPVVLFSFWDFLDLKLPEILVGAVFWLLAAIVLHAGPELPTNRVFAAVAACVAAHRLTAISSVITDTQWLVNLPKIGHMLAAGLIGPLLIHLSLLFPTPLTRIPRNLLIVLYSLGMLSGIMLASRSGAWTIWPVNDSQAIFNLFYRLVLLLLLGGIITLFVRLVLAWLNRRTADLRERRIVRIVLVGLLVSLPPVIVVLAPLIPEFGSGRTTFLMGLDLRYFMLAIPVAFALAIIRYQTFQSTSPLFIFVIALSISALLADIAVAIWAQSLPPGRITTVRSPFPELLTFILAASVFWSRQADWRGWFGRFLNRTDRNYESVRSFGKRVMSRNDLSAMPETMAQALVDELELERSAVWLWQPESARYELVAAAGIQEPSLPSSLAPSYPPTLFGRILQVSDPSLPGWLAQPMIAGQIEVLVPLEIENRAIGMLGLGRRWDEDLFDERDLAVVELVGQQAALFILAAAQVEELRRVPERVAAAQEQERYRLAAELHDTIQQFLGRLPFFLTVSRDKMADDREGAAAILDRCMADVEEASILLREIRANLAPNQLETSLIKPLTGLAAYMERQTGLNIDLDAPESLDDATSAGTRHALYRIIQQATDNVIAHADATQVTITLRRLNGRIHFAVIDDGRGSTNEDRLRAISRGSFGLQSMRARVETVGGEFAFHSVDGVGTTVSGWVPAAE